MNQNSSLSAWVFRFVCLPLVLAAMTASLPDKLAAKEVRAKQGLVVSNSPDASLAGAQIMRAGGNAVDAAVATALAMAVTWPEAGNIGGGGFMMIQPADGSPAVCIDYREMAPGNATATMFDRSDGSHTRKIVGVPGTVRGLGLAHEKYGKLSWEQVVQPAVKLARDGFVVDKFLAASMNRVLSSRITIAGERFAELRRVYGKPSGEPWQAGDRIVLSDLAGTLERIADKGPAEFYVGRTADLLVTEMQRGDGRITKADLAAYKPKIRKPMFGTFHGFQVLGPPPPSSGGTCILEALNILENFDLAAHDRFSARTMHLIAEAARFAFCDRARHLGDPDFIDIPPHLTSKTYAQRLAARIDPGQASNSLELAPDIPMTRESESTTHFSVIDAAGMAVSNTYTLEHSWGSRIVVKGGGFLLNNEMGDFNWIPGETNLRGRIGTRPNQIAPHKRMLSSQTPVIVTRDGRVVLVTGSPGGRTIINTVLNILVSCLAFDMGLDEAVRAPRSHHGWLPDELQVEGRLDRSYVETLDQLRSMGHTVRIRGSGQGSAHSIGYDGESQLYIGVADPRRGGLAAAVDRND